MARITIRRRVVLVAILVASVPTVVYPIYLLRRHDLFLNRGIPKVRAVLTNGRGIVLLTDDVYNIALVFQTKDPAPGVAFGSTPDTASISIISNLTGIVYSDPFEVTVPADCNTLIIVDVNGTATRFPLPTQSSATIRDAYFKAPDSFQQWLDASSLVAGR